MTTAKKIIWMSRHAPTLSQLRELDRLFPGHNLQFDPASFSGADDIVARFRANKGDEMVVVAPWTVIRAITKRGIQPIYAEMKQVPCHRGSHEVSIGEGKRRRCYEFVKFYHCASVKLDLIEIQPPTTNTQGE